MFELKQIPNVITICRILIIFPTLWLLYFDQYKDALVLLIIAGLSDALDGYLARAFNWKTRLGSIMDPIADKFLIASSFLVLTIQGIVPVWVTAIILGRDLIIFSGAIAYRFFYKDLEIAPSMLSKMNTALQIFGVIFLVLSHSGYPYFATEFEGHLSYYLFYLLASLGLISGLDYVIVWSRKAFSYDFSNQKYDEQIKDRSE